MNKLFVFCALFAVANAVPYGASPNVPAYGNVVPAPVAVSLVPLGPYDASPINPYDVQAPSVVYNIQPARLVNAEVAPSRLISASSGAVAEAAAASQNVQLNSGRYAQYAVPSYSIIGDAPTLDIVQVGSVGSYGAPRSSYGRSGY